MARTDPQLNIRIPADLKSRLEAAAQASGRSVTTELITRLDESFQDRPSARDLAARVEESSAELKELIREFMKKHTAAYEAVVSPPAATNRDLVEAATPSKKKIRS